MEAGYPQFKVSFLPIKINLLHLSAVVRGLVNWQQYTLYSEKFNEDLH